jgi:hypothetical protein
MSDEWFRNLHEERRGKEEGGGRGIPTGQPTAISVPTLLVIRKEDD